MMMSKTVGNPPPLQACLSICKQQLLQQQQTPGQAAELYRAAIQLLGALKQDQAVLLKRCVGSLLYFRIRSRLE